VNRKLAVVVNRNYRSAMANFARASSLDVWYQDMEIDKVLEIFEISSRKARTSVQKVIKRHSRVHKNIQRKS
jgi:hypothetical protein